MSPSDFVSPTFKDNGNSQRINTVDLSIQDLTVLKANDPFAYFSIPAVKNAALRQKAVDVSDLPRSTDINGGQAGTVERQMRHSFECSPELLLDFADVDSNGSDFETEVDDDGDDVLFDTFLNTIQAQASLQGHCNGEPEPELEQ